MAKRKQPKLIAILHDGNFDGDSGFYVHTDVGSINTIEYTGQAFEELKAEYLRRCLSEVDEGVVVDFANTKQVKQLLDEYGYDMPKGAWIVDSKGMDAIDIVTDIDCGSDSSTYTVNHIAKRIAHHAAVQHLGQRARKSSGYNDAG